MLKVFYLLGWFCLNGECVTINEKHQLLEDCKIQGTQLKSLLDESTQVLGTSEVIVFTNSKDRDVVQSTLANFAGSELSSETIECIGGVKIQSKDGAMKFDNTIDAKIDRLKPLIRKEIASKFGVKE